MDSLFYAALANCYFMGEESTPEDQGFPNILHCVLGRYRVTLVQKQEACKPPNQNQRGEFKKTTKLILEGIPINGSHIGERIAVDVATLLSFATMSQVRAFAFYHGDKAWRHSVVGQTILWRPTLNISKGTDIRTYMESTWKNFRMQKKSRQLIVLIEYLVSSEVPRQPLEVKLLQGFVALEHLKATWARSHGYPFFKGRFREMNSGESLSFEALLSRALKEVGMRPGLKRIIALRNEIIHQGLSNRKPDSLFATYERVHDIIREYLLRLLGYSGSYHPYSRPNDLKRL